MQRWLSQLILVLCLVGLVSPAQAAVTWFWTAESTTLDCTGTPCTGSDYTNGTDTVGSTSGASIGAAAAKLGTNGVLVDATNDDIQFNSETGVHNRLKGTAAGWFYVNTWVNDASLVYARDVSSSGNRIAVVLTNADDLQLQISSSTPTSYTISTSGAGLTTGNWYFFMAQWDQTTDDSRIAVYNSSGTLIAENEALSTAFTAPLALAMTHGFSVGERAGPGGTPAFYLDNIFWADEYADATTILCNRDITTYANYAACGGGGSSHNAFRLRVIQ